MFALHTLRALPPLLCQVARRAGSVRDNIFRAIEQRAFKDLQEALTRHPEEINVSNRLYGGTPLHYLVGAGVGHIATPVIQAPPQRYLNLLLEAGANVHGVNEYGDTPLGVAAKTGYTQAVGSLMQAGAHPTIEMLRQALLRTVNPDPYFRVERRLAAHLDREQLRADGAELLAELIKSVKDNLSIAPYVESAFGDCPRWNAHAVKSTHFDLLADKIRFLLEQGVDPDDKYQGMTALQRVFTQLDTVGTSRWEDKALRPAVPMLVKYTTDPHATDENGWTLLHWAVYTGQPQEVLTKLIEKGAKPDVQSPTGLTPRDLRWLRPQKNWEAGHSLLIHAVLHRLPKSLRTPYWEKREVPHLTDCKRLFTTGLSYMDQAFNDLYACKDGHTPMAQAIAEGNTSGIYFLLKRGWNVDVETDMAMQEMLKTGKPVVRFTDAFRKARGIQGEDWPLHGFFRAPGCGVSTESELLSACAHFQGDEERLIILLTHPDYHTRPSFKELFSKKFLPIATDAPRALARAAARDLLTEEFRDKILQEQKMMDTQLSCVRRDLARADEQLQTMREQQSTSNDHQSW